MSSPIAHLSTRNAPGSPTFPRVSGCQVHAPCSSSAIGASHNFMCAVLFDCYKRRWISAGLPVKTCRALHLLASTNSFHSIPFPINAADVRLRCGPRRHVMGSLRHHLGIKVLVTWCYHHATHQRRHMRRMLATPIIPIIRVEASIRGLLQPHSLGQRGCTLHTRDVMPCDVLLSSSSLLLHNSQLLATHRIPPWHASTFQSTGIA